MNAVTKALCIGAALLAFGSSARAQSQNVTDDKVGRIITLLERMDERIASVENRMDSMDGRLRALEGNSRSPGYSPTSYQARYTPASYSAGAYTPVSYSSGSSTPARLVPSYSTSGQRYAGGGSGGNSCNSVRNYDPCEQQCVRVRYVQSRCQDDDD